MIDTNPSKIPFLLLDIVSVCLEYLGMENGDIPRGNIRASGHSGNYYPSQARLNGPSTWKSGYGPQWIQADIGYQTYVAGVITQGHTNNWVSSFKVSIFQMTTVDDEIYVSEGGEAKVKMTILMLLLQPIPCYLIPYVSMCLKQNVSPHITFA